MNDAKTRKSVKTLCEESRQSIADQLSAIVTTFLAKATGTDASVPHAKFLVDLMQLQPAQEEKKPKSADETPAEQKSDEPGLAQVMLDTLREMMEESKSELNATALP